MVADTGIDVTSGGTRALVGRPMDPGSSRLLELGGVPAQDFRARQLAREMVAEADLVLGGRAGASQLRRPTVSAGHAQSDHYVVPMVVGGGTPWLPPGLRLDLRLVGHHRFGCGVVHLVYDVAG